MERQIIVNSVPGERRIAILEDGRLVEYSVYRSNDRRCLGNIYRGTVKRIVPGMQSAFVDFGHERTGFIYLRDLRKDISYEELEHDPDEEETNGRQTAPQVPEYVREGQQIIVQVVKEPIGLKGARLTTHVTLPGRFAVLMPTIRHIGLSKKISDPTRRRDLEEIAKRTAEKGYGIIIRTMAAEAGNRMVEREIALLIKKWQTIQQRFKKGKTEGIIGEEANPLIEAVKNTYTEDLSAVICDQEEDYRDVQAYVSSFIPERQDAVRLHDLPYPIFEYYGIEAELERGLSKKIWLKSGGFIYIEPTEALTVIDVNTGKFLGHESLEQTVLRTNLEAAEEIAYQLRLRNIAGIIVVDFIDMRHHMNRQRVIKALETFLARDPAKSSVYQFTRLGLIQITRKRTTESTYATLTEPCPYCSGTGGILSRGSVGFSIIHDIIRRNRLHGVKRFCVTAHPDVIFSMEHTLEAEMKELRRAYRLNIELVGDGSLHREHFLVSEN